MYGIVINRRMKTLLGWTGAVLLMLAIGGGGYLGYLGYFSSDPFTPVPVAADAPKADYAVAFLSGDMGFNAGMGPKMPRGSLPMACRCWASTR